MLQAIVQTEDTGSALPLLLPSHEMLSLQLFHSLIFFFLSF